MKRFTAASGLVLVALLGVARAPVADAIGVLQVVHRMQDAMFAGKDLRARVDFEIVNAQGESVHWASHCCGRRWVPS